MKNIDSRIRRLEVEVRDATGEQWAAGTTLWLHAHYAATPGIEAQAADLAARGIKWNDLPAIVRSTIERAFGDRGDPEGWVR